MEGPFSETSAWQRGYWVLKGVTREFYVCTTAGSRNYRTALCVFDSEVGAEGYLRKLGGSRDFVETMGRHGMQVPDWMRREPELPAAHEANVPELRRIAGGIGVEWLAVNPPPIEPHPDPHRADVLALVGVEELDVPPNHTTLPDTTIHFGEEEAN